LLLDFWLVIGRGTGGSDRPSVKVNAAYPRLAANERAINLKLTLPIALFETPSLTARIEVEQPEQAITIDTSVIAEAVRQCIGMDVSISVSGPEGGAA
jgi:hypothetical protein